MNYKKDGYHQQNVRQRQKLISIIDYDYGSVLGPRQFILYTADLEDHVAEHGVSFHAFADDSNHKPAVETTTVNLRKRHA